MAELTFNPQDITAGLRKNLEGYSPQTEMARVGRIIEVGDGIARFSGLPGAAVNELLEFEGGTLGLALNLDEESIGAVVLGDVGHIEEGQSVKATGNILQVPVGDALLGRVVDALGNPIDGKGPLQGAQQRRMEIQAPGITGRAMGQHWMDSGDHALAVYDDLSKQAEAYRQIALLLRRPPGREAYPGDVFYLHSRLLERAAKLNDELGAGSLTALPVIETKAGDVSAYIPTNVISITDGQIYLQEDLFRSGVRPAVDVGISVSRVGGAAQIRAMRSVAGTLKVDLAPFRDLEAFAPFAPDLDAVSKAQLERGYRLVELLKQPLNSPMAVEEQVVSIFAGTRGYLDDIPVADVRRFERELLEFMRTRNASLLDELRTGGVPDAL